jgi:predicted ester cyclase
MVSRASRAGAASEVVSEMTLSDESPAGVGTSETERNKAVIRRFIEEVQNHQDWAVYDEVNDPSFVNLSAPPGVPADREGGKLYLQALASAYPDAHVTIDDMIAEGDQVVTKKTFSGTNTGEFAGMPATGRPVTIQYVDIMRIRDGRIVEHWLSMDQLAWMQQLGLAPA